MRDPDLIMACGLPEFVETLDSPVHELCVLVGSVLTNPVGVALVIWQPLPKEMTANIVIAPVTGKHHRERHEQVIAQSGNEQVIAVGDTGWRWLDCVNTVGSPPNAAYSPPRASISTSIVDVTSLESWPMESRSGADDAAIASTRVNRRRNW